MQHAYARNNNTNEGDDWKDEFLSSGKRPRVNREHARSPGTKTTRRSLVITRLQATDPEAAEYLMLFDGL